MQYSVRQIADVTMIRIEGRVDHASARDFEDGLKPQLEETAAEGSAGILLDLGGLSYMTSAGLRVLMIAAKACASQQRELAVAELQPVIEEIFKISRFDLVLKIYPTVEAGLEGISSRAAEAWRGETQGR